ncbi:MULTISPECIES: invasion associated locus B family protein [Xanthobacter]|uniref:invasion associated locus B family protein n=1 Tax=Xanthobacter TaxID=279 RepID=UPI001F44BBF8|nr:MULTISPECIES: invasion associated locus B family protein [unclassified Xanthobacter]
MVVSSRGLPLFPASRGVALRGGAGWWARAFSALGGLKGLLLVATLAVAALGSSSPAAAQGVVKSVHGEWQIRCDTPPGAQGEQCVLLQSVQAEDRPNVGLTVIVLKTADQKSRLLRVLAPLGVLLPAGLGLKIDDQDVGRAGFVRCLPNGCVAEVVMDDNLISRLKSGKQATFIIFQTPEEGIGVPLSLEGFGPGLDALK